MGEQAEEPPRLAGGWCEPQRVSLLQTCSCSAACIRHSRNHLGGISMVSAALEHIPGHLKAKAVPLSSPGRSR